MRKRASKLIALMSGCAAIITYAVCIPAMGQVQTGSDTQWLSGKALLDSGQLPVSVSWLETPIRMQLQLISKQQQRSVFLDRRVDPTQRMTLSIRDLTIEQVVWQTAQSGELGVARVGDLLYVGPPESAARLTHVIDQLKRQISKLPKSQRTQWTRRSEIRWPAGTSTQEFIKWFEQTHQIKFNGAIPNDVWAAGDWPSLSLLEQLSLFLVGFDRSLKIDSAVSNLEIIPFPKLEESNLKFRLQRDTKFDLNEAKKEFKDLKIRQSGKTILLTGPVDEIARFEAWRVKRQSALGSHLVTRTFDLNATEKRGDILATLAAQTGRKLVLKGNAAESLAARIKIDVKKATLETLIVKCLEGTGLQHQLSDSLITVFSP